MPIQWVNAKDIMEIHNKTNTTNHLTYTKAIEVKEKCIELYEKEFGHVERFNKNLIPLDWYETYFGTGLLCKKGKEHKKGTSKAATN